MQGGYDLFKLEHALEAMKGGQDKPSKIVVMSKTWVEMPQERKDDYEKRATEELFFELLKIQETIIAERT